MALNKFCVKAIARASDAFPKFDDGDVKIRLSTRDTDIFHLHSFLLGLHSPVLKSSLGQRWFGKSGPVPEEKKRIKWSYELRFEPNQTDGMLYRKDHVLDEFSSVTAVLFNPTIRFKGNLYKERQGSSGNKSVEAHRQSVTAALFNPTIRFKGNPDEERQGFLRNESVEAHRHLLMILYHIPFETSTEDFDTIRASLENLVIAAELYECPPLVARYIDRQLLPFKVSKEVFRACMDSPSELIRFAIYVRADWMFKYAFVYLLGQPLIWADHRDALESMGLTLLFSKKSETFLKEIYHLALDFVLFPYKSTSREMQMAGFFLRSLATELLRNIVDRDFVNNRWTQIVRFFVTSDILEIGYAELRSFLSDMHSRLRIKLVSAYVTSYIAQSIGVATKLLTNPSNVDTMYHPCAGTSTAPLVCFEITDDDLPWKKASS